METKKIFEYVKDKYSEKEAKIYYSYIIELVNDKKNKWTE